MPGGRPKSGQDVYTNKRNIFTKVQTFNNSTPIINPLTASKPVFTNATKGLTSIGPGSSLDFQKGDGSLDSSTYIKPTGSSSEFIKANGSFDGTAYLDGAGDISAVPVYSNTHTLGDSLIGSFSNQVTVSAELDVENGAEYATTIGSTFLFGNIIATTTGAPYNSYIENRSNGDVNFNVNIDGGDNVNNATYAWMRVSMNTADSLTHWLAIESMNPSMGSWGVPFLVDSDNNDVWLVPSTPYAFGSGGSSQGLVGEVKIGGDRTTNAPLMTIHNGGSIDFYGSNAYLSALSSATSNLTFYGYTGGGLKIDATASKMITIQGDDGGSPAQTSFGGMDLINFRKFYDTTVSAGSSGDIFTSTGTGTLWQSRLAAGTPVIADTKSLPNQSADITTTNFANASTAGLYEVDYVLEDTTSALAAGSVVLTIAWTDGAGATTSTATQLLTGVGRVSGHIAIELASGAISYATSHTGIFSTAKYALFLTCQRTK